MSLAEAIKAEALALGFDAVGISRVTDSYQPSANSLQQSPPLDPATPLSHHLFGRLSEWLRLGYYGTMAWMTRDPSRRSDPRLVLPGCKSMLSVGMNYYTDNRANEQPGMGRIARYAWGQDYHEVMSQRLAQLEAKIAALAPGVTTRTYVDTGPIMEKAWAQQAGLGWIGKHSNLVSAESGSWLLLGEILTTLELEPDEPATDLCGSCTLCIQACPTGAIVEPYVVDARLCISYLTIELRGDRDVIPNELASQMGNHIFGCDDCLDVCPFNLRSDATSEPAFAPTPITLAPSLQALAQINEESFAATFKGSPIKRAKRNGLLRNVKVAQENLTRQTGGRAS
ncbi:MAG: tRNA epoxyqueuosine(34) reductase QueG [Nitrospirota bacterium]|nr:tRNA epoxyqueuosine(34) reductase QueG [Nitrospirota bacterium]MDP2382871.1 tRNA epoxyqueuosine(34) reductase QueG [Nitrospirota bacterium]MDP3598917.1 tRNA epoxyqueuosine(34) reductase QueG [Nitrospirota bacterium]